MFSAYETNTSALNYVTDSDSDFGGACDIEDNPTRESSTTMTNNAFDGGDPFIQIRNHVMNLPYWDEIE